ncbi:MAG: hypothetical protein M3547_00175 [Acidobacteriota bacterium]|nr:hypothetical protein [Acidobacteriota bacterium]
MATRLYLRNTTINTDAGLTAEQSSAKPVGTLNASLSLRDLNTVKGSAQLDLSRNSLAQTTHQDGIRYVGFSAGLVVTQIDANTWSFGLASNEANTNANTFTTVTLYVWRPSTNAVVGFIIDDDTPRGVEWGATEDGQVFTVSGSAVSGVQAGDQVVFEWWYHSVQGMATAYLQQFFYDGATDVVDATTTDAASYIETPQDLFTAPPEFLPHNRTPLLGPILAQ